MVSNATFLNKIIEQTYFARVSITNKCVFLLTFSSVYNTVYRLFFTKLKSKFEKGKKMSLVIGDIHGNVSKVERFLAYKPLEEHIFLGDICDSFYFTRENMAECIKLITTSNNSQLILGNHELHYIDIPPFICSGRDELFARSYRPFYSLLTCKTNVNVAIARDGYLLTHAGVCSGLAKSMNLPPNSDEAAEMLNKEFWSWHEGNHYNSNKIFNISIERGGINSYGGIFWFDFYREKKVSNKFKQIFGHTERSKPEQGENWFAIDTTNSKDIWIFDTKKEKLQQI